MKRVLIILFVVSNIIGLCLLTSCMNENAKPINSKGLGGGASDTEVYVLEVEYNGHSYLEFKDYSQYGQGWVHNPDCKCFNKN